jgi:hypothetical protein
MTWVEARQAGDETPIEANTGSLRADLTLGPNNGVDIISVNYGDAPTIEVHGDDHWTRLRGGGVAFSDDPVRSSIRLAISPTPPYAY